MKHPKIALPGKRKDKYNLIIGGHNWDLGSLIFDRPDPECQHCKGSGGVQTGENEYSTCPCVFDKEEPRSKKPVK